MKGIVKMKSSLNALRFKALMLFFSPFLPSDTHILLSLFCSFNGRSNKYLKVPHNSARFRACIWIPHIFCNCLLLNSDTVKVPALPDQSVHPSKTETITISLEGGKGETKMAPLKQNIPSES